MRTNNFAIFNHRHQNRVALIGYSRYVLIVDSYCY